IADAGLKDEAIHTQELRLKVNKYRERMIEDEIRREKAAADINQNKGFWKPSSVCCEVCGKLNHNTRECDYTYERIVARIRGEENQKAENAVLAEKGGILPLRNSEGNKQRGIAIKGKEEILERFKNVFFQPHKKIEFCSLEKCTIRTKKGAKVVKKGVVIPQALRKDTDSYIRDLEERGVLRRSNSEWRNPIRALQKPNGSIRLVSNFMALNDLCEKDPYELKTINEVINATQGYNFFTVLDLKEGFYSIEIVEADKHKTAFEFDGRIYEWNSMVMGYKNAPQILQRVLTKVLESELGDGVSVYMDDIVVCGKSRLDHDTRLRRVLDKLSENKLKVN
ncbi:MAG: reverse transcriptase family protein, partial [Aeromonas sp.]